MNKESNEGNAKRSLHILTVREGSHKGKGKFCVCMAKVSPELERILLAKKD